MEKLDKLTKLLELTQNDTLTPSEVKSFLDSVYEFITKHKIEFQNISSETLKQINDYITQIEENNTKWVNTQDSKTNAMVGQFEAKIAVLKGLIDKVQTIKPIDGKDGVDGVDGKDGKDGSPDTRKEIIDKINSGKKTDSKIELKQIEGAEKLSTQENLDNAISILDQRTQYLINKKTSSTDYTLPTASASTLGGIKVGTRLSIDGNGVLSADVQGGGGDVVAPATNTDSYIPQWDGANSKTLKDGLAVPAGGLAGLTALGNKLDTSAFSDTGVTGKLITGFTSGAGALAGTDTILQAINKLDGNIGTKQATLVSGTNIKTINGASILASGDLTLLSSLSGAVLTDQTTPQTIGATGARLAMLWATDITVSNAISGSVTGNAGTVTNGIYTTSQVTGLAAVTNAGDKGKYLFNNASTGALEWATVASAGATTALDNLANVAINAALIPGTAGALDLGSTAKPWGTLWFSGASATPGTNQFNLTGTSTSGVRTITAPDRSITLDNITTSTTTAGTGFLKGNGSVISFDNSTYLTSLSGALLATGATTGATSQAQTLTSGVILGTNASVLGTAKFFGSTSGDVTLQPNAIAGTGIVLTMPATTGTLALTSDIVSQVEDNITDGHTTIAPSGNAVFDALALKAPLASPVFTTQITTPLIYGSSVANGDITIEGTSDATKTTSYVILQPTTGNVGIGTTGPAQQLEITKAFRFPHTTDSTTGVIYKGTDAFFHDFAGAGTDGMNLFVGTSVGNFTMSKGGGASALASYNIGLGGNTLTGLTTGNKNIGLGTYTLTNTTLGYENMAIGHASMYTNTEGYRNTAIGGSTLYSNVTGYSNIAIGYSALQSNTAYENTAIGYFAMAGIVSGIDNTAIGKDSGYGDGTTNEQSSVDTYMTFLGTRASRHSSIAQATVLTNSTAIGYNTKILASNQVVVGNDSVTSTLLKGVVTTNNSIELGHASDTTIARVSAGVISVEGARVITSTGTTSGTILKNNGTTFVASTETYAAPGTSGNIMTSDGTNWTSAAPSAGVPALAQYAVGTLNNALVKTYFNIQLPFTLWTGSTNGALTTDFVNWVRDTSNIFVLKMGTEIDFRSTGAAEIYLNTIFVPTDSAALAFGATNIIILDWWAKLPATGTGDINMGFGNDDSFPLETYNSTTQKRVTFSQRGSTGVLYATTTNGASVTNTDVSAGITVTNWNNYRIELDLSNEAKFYINGTLVATITTNLPSSGIIDIGFGRSNTSLFQVMAPNLSVQMNP